MSDGLEALEGRFDIRTEVSPSGLVHLTEEPERRWPDEHRVSSAQQTGSTTDPRAVVCALVARRAQAPPAKL